eukprot:scaffold7352_cov254-Pinguiococcus_pyrenoidosus.AAC.25
MHRRHKKRAEEKRAGPSQQQWQRGAHTGHLRLQRLPAHTSSRHRLCAAAVLRETLKVAFGPLSLRSRSTHDLYHGRIAGLYDCSGADAASHRLQSHEKATLSSDGMRLRVAFIPHSPKSQLTTSKRRSAK